MKLFRFLRKFNIVAFAILSVLAIVLLFYAILQVRSEHARYAAETAGDVVESGSQRKLWAENIRFEDRVISVYSRGDPNDPVQRDLRFVDTRDGTTTLLLDDPTLAVTNQGAVGFPGSGRADQGYGYFVSVRVGSEGGTELYDAWYVRFSDMRKFKIASSIKTFDGPHPLDRKSFSAITWDAADRGRFLIFDSEKGAIVTQRDLEFDGG